MTSNTCTTSSTRIDESTLDLLQIYIVTEISKDLTGSEAFWGVYEVAFPEVSKEVLVAALGLENITERVNGGRSEWQVSKTDFEARVGRIKVQVYCPLYFLT